MHYIIVPGWNSSDSAHWQSVWETDWLPGATRIAPASWTHPERDDWVDAIERSVRASADEVVFVAHSLGCYAVRHWLASTSIGDRVRGAFLVAPPDQEAETYPAELLSTFLDSEPVAVSFPGVLVASDDDPYCTLGAAARKADDWQLPLVSAGPLGHINSDSNLADWPLGQRLLTTFTAGLGRL
jgi:predicted alpha/beta hydrolase family esterase